MSNFTPTLSTDYYKTTHKDQYNPKMTKLVSYYTPRMSRISEDKLVVFGLQGFIKYFLIDKFNNDFFGVSKENAVKKYARMMKYTMGDRFANTEHWEKLWDLGYLPLQISALPEGMRVPMKVPAIEIVNTHEDFVWLVNFIETELSCFNWHTEASANVGYRFRQIVNQFYGETVDDTVPKHTAIGDFSMRGQESDVSAAKSSAAFLLSFSKTATIPAIEFLEEYYNCDVEKELVATGLASTEHSVMCSNFAIDGDEETMVKRLLTEIYPDNNFSMVSDSYDYWNMVTNILAKPDIKELVLNHNGFMAVRPDSGNPADIVCGSFAEHYRCDLIEPDIKCEEMERYFKYKAESESRFEVEYHYWYAKVEGKLYYVKCYHNWVEDSKSSCGGYYDSSIDEVEITEINLSTEEKGTVELLWEIYGGYINSKGYKVLNDHIRVVYGDSITPEKAEEIYRKLRAKGFASNNVILGMGSYSLQSCEGNTPLTRDTYSIAVKSTYCEVGDKSYFIFKDPKTDSGNFKKSQKGCCRVFRNDNNELEYEDELTFSEVERKRYTVENLLHTVFADGHLIIDTSLQEIRNRLHGGRF